MEKETSKTHLKKMLRNAVLYLVLVLGFWYFYGPKSKFDKGLIGTSIQFVYSKF